MARTSIDIDAPVEAVFDVLADAGAYGSWVVGSKEVRDAEPHWPAAGATFHHTQGTGAATVKDTTTVIEAQPPNHLVLEVRARPWVVNVVELSLGPAPGGGTRVWMYEHPTGGIAARVWNPALDRVLQARNLESLRRLARLVRDRAGERDGRAA
jgi:uncharacterized protein YndB with AHSA1/START domain